ncbi:hypothetical protein [Dactylosporangium sp. NPDC051541]|uniref:hypothetical protein n=1 Tax=Dactylosporangium sp. NPDC051541 TaxID=3363977 RepID=UPI0037B92660
MAWLHADPSDRGERRVRRTGAALVVAGLTLVAAVMAAVVVLTDRDEGPPPAPHRGDQRATFRSDDGRIEAAVYRINAPGRFGPVTEVVLRPAGATLSRDMVSFGCTDDDDGLTIVAVTVRPDSIVARNYNGDERTIRFDPGTLRPEATLGSC